MNVDKVLEQLAFHNENYEWIVEQAAEIQKKLNKLKPSQHKKCEQLEKQFTELQKRYAANEPQYNQLVDTVKKYFKDKYDIDIQGLIRGDDAK